MENQRTAFSRQCLKRATVVRGAKMTVRARLLLSGAMTVLAIATGPMISTSYAADVAMPVKAMPTAEPVPFWWFSGEVEVGGRFFLNNPQKDGINSQGGRSLAKYYEY